MEILGRDESVRRLDEARSLTSSSAADRDGKEKNEAGETREWMGSLAGVASGGAE